MSDEEILKGFVQLVKRCAGARELAQDLSWHFYGVGHAFLSLQSSAKGTSEQPLLRALGSGRGSLFDGSPWIYARGETG